MTKRKGLMFYELGLDQLVGSRPIDVLAAGTFIDMAGRRITIEPEELEEYIENTRPAIEETRTESGELVGFPIDPNMHNGDTAAGWITDVFLGERANGDPVIRAEVRWTSVGQELIGEGLFRFFSATFDMTRKVILGGSLTNWPATRDIEDGRPLLRPIELSERSYRMDLAEGDPVTDDKSTNEELNEIYQAFYEVAETVSGPEPWVEDVYEDQGFIIVSQGGDYYRVEFERSEEGGLQFAAQESWLKVKNVWVEASRAAFRRIADTFQELAARLVPDNGKGRSQREGDGDESLSTATVQEAGSTEETDSTEVNTMEIKLEDLTPEQRQELASGAIADLAQGEDGLANLSGNLAQMIESEIEKGIQARLTEQQRSDRIANLVADLTGGDEDDAPAGLPVQPTQLEEFLSRLDEEQLDAAETIFGTIREKGVVNFQEAGHGRKGSGGKRELPEEYAVKLDSGEMEIADLSSPMISAELGELSDYDLSKWKEGAAE